MKKAKNTQQETASMLTAIVLIAAGFWIYDFFSSAQAVKQPEQQVAAPALETKDVQMPPKMGLGVTLDAFSKTFRGKGFYFDYAQPVDGEPRVIAKGDDSQSIASMELIGDPSDITHATLMLGISSDGQHNFGNTVLVFMFVNQVFTDWPESNQWVSDSIADVLESKKSSQAKKEKTVDGKIIRVVFYKELSILNITIESSK